MIFTDSSDRQKVRVGPRRQSERFECLLGSPSHQSPFGVGAQLRVSRLMKIFIGRRSWCIIFLWNILHSFLALMLLLLPLVFCLGS